MDIFCKALPEYIVQQVEESHYHGLYAWIAADGGSDGDANVLNVRFANSNYTISLDDFPFETLAYAHVEAVRLNLRRGIDDDVAAQIMRSSDWIEPRDMGDEVSTSQDRQERMHPDSPEDDDFDEEVDYNIEVIDPFT